MRSFLACGGGLAISIFVCGAVIVACGDETESPPATTPDGGGLGLDTGTSPTNDSGQGQVDTGVADTGNNNGDADDGGGGPKNSLYAHIDGKLVSVDATTGALTDVGPTGEDWITLAWDGTAKVARVITGNYTPLAAPAPTPKLGTINLCTGVITPGPAIAIAGTQVRRSEALAQNPTTGVFFISVGVAGTSASSEFLSESNGTIDVATGAVTVLGNHQTVQDDGDCNTFIGNEHHMLDVASTSNGAIYKIDQTTGAATKTVDVGPNLRRIAYDSSRGVLFGSYGEGVEPNATKREIVIVNPATGARTSLGTVIADATYGGRHFNGLLSVPKPTCP